MSLYERTHYTVICDSCRRSFGYFDADRYPPQEVLRLAEDNYGWFVDDETTICATCPQPTDEGDIHGAG